MRMLESAYRDLRRANFRLIEKELYNYEARKRDYERMRSNIIESTYRPEVSVQSGLGDTTALKVVRLQSGVMLETARRLAAIEYAIGVIRNTKEPAVWDLVRMKYFEQRLTDEQIMRILHISRDTFYRWRREFIRLIADRLGWEI